MHFSLYVVNRKIQTDSKRINQAVPAVREKLKTLEIAWLILVAGFAGRNRACSRNRLTVKRREIAKCPRMLTLHGPERALSLVHAPTPLS